MNKIVNIHLAGSVYHMDEMGYQLLKNYLSEVENFLQPDPEVKEIIYDIEQRISELLKVELQERKAATKKDVEKIIHEMGRPETYGDEKIKHQRVFVQTSLISKKLFRNKDDKYIAGVCSGLAIYSGVDVLWVRLLAIFLFFTPLHSVLIYIVFWVLLPYAKTTSDKLRMHGKPINFDTIKDSFQENFSEEPQADLKNVTSKTSNTLKKIFRSILIFFPKIISILLIIVGIFAIGIVPFAWLGNFTGYHIENFLVLLGFLSILIGVLILRKIRKK